MESLYSFLIAPKLARNLINRGRGWSLLLSMTFVWAAAVCLALFANASGYRCIGILVADEGDNLFASIFNSLLTFIALWTVFTVFVSVRRATLFNRPPGIDIEAQCFCLPFAFILPGILLIKVFTAAMDSKFILFYGNVLIIFVFLNLLAVGYLLITEKGNLKSLGSASSRETARLFKMKMLGHRHCGLSALLTAGIITVAGGMFFSYYDVLPVMFNMDFVARILSCIALSLFIWIAASWMTGRYRIRNIGDAYGMKIATVAVGWSIARFYIIIIVAFVVREIVNRSQPVSDNGFDVIVKAVVLAAVILFSADLFLTINSILTLSARYLPIIDINTDTLGVLPNNTQPESLTQSGFEAAFKAIGEIDLPNWRTVLAFVWGLVTMNVNMLRKLDLTGSSVQSLATCCAGVCLLPLATLIHGVTLGTHLKPAFGHFVNLRTFDIDFIAGAGSCTLYIVLMILTLYVLTRFLREMFSLPSICALVGFSMVPLTIGMLLCAFLSEKIRLEASEVLYPAATFWAFVFLVLNIGLMLIRRRRVFVVLPAVVVVILLMHLLANQLIWKSHMHLMEIANVPVIKIRSSIADEAPPDSRDDVLAAVNRLENVDLVSMRASDLIRHVLYTEKVSRRFYGYIPDGMLRVRISHEVTNGNWMQALNSCMTRITKHANGVDDAAHIVFDWIRTTVPKVEPVTFPLGNKFDQDPITTLRCRQGNQMDVAILMVAALRASGVAARISDVWLKDYVTGAYCMAEYFDGQHWKPCYPWFGRLPKQKSRTSSRNLEDVTTWISKVPEAKIYTLSNGLWTYCTNGNKAHSLPPGTYLASYVVGNTCHVRQFILKAEK